MAKKNKLLVTVKNLNDIEILKSDLVDAFLFPVKEFAIGYENTFEVNEIPSDINSYILVNRILNCTEIEELKKILSNLPKHINGIIFEDIGLFGIVKKLDLDVELIWWQNHFACSTEIIDFWLDNGVTSAILSNELTEEEIMEITGNSKKPLIIEIFGCNQIMYSKRKLITNYVNFYNETPTNKLYLSVDKIDFNLIAKEDNNGTIFFYESIYDARRLKDLDNIKYLFIDSNMIDTKSVIEIIKNLDNDEWGIDSLNLKISNHFLDKETIYKIVRGVM